MDYKEAFDYVEATFNYKYVNYDYSKCANTKIFTSSVSINTNANGEITMVDIKAAYDAILADWHNKYYSVEEEDKTPIVLDITDVTSSIVKYTMVVGYGYVDLSEWGKAFVPPPGTIFWETAQTWMTYCFENHLDWVKHNITNGRPYFINVGHKADFGYKGPLNVNDPTPGDGFIDNYFWYTEKGKPGYHFLLYQWEYSYHVNAYFTFVQEFISSLPNANACSYSGMGIDYYPYNYNPNGPNPIWPDKAGLIPDIFYGRQYTTNTNLSAL